MDDDIRDECVAGTDSDIPFRNGRRSTVKPLGITPTTTNLKLSEAAKRKMSAGELSIASNIGGAADGGDHHYSSVRFLDASVDEIEEDVDDDIDGGAGSLAGETGMRTPPTPPESAFFSSFGGTYDSTRNGTYNNMQVSTIHSTVSANTGGGHTRPTSSDSQQSALGRAAANAAGKFGNRKHNLDGGDIEEDIDESSEIISMRALTGEFMTLKLFSLLTRGSSCAVFQALHLGNPGMGMGPNDDASLSLSMQGKSDASPLEHLKGNRSVSPSLSRDNSAHSPPIAPSAPTNGEAINSRLHLARSGSLRSASIDDSASPMGLLDNASFGMFSGSNVMSGAGTSNLQSIPLAVKTIFVQSAGGGPSSGSEFGVRKRLSGESNIATPKSNRASPKSAHGVLPPALMAAGGELPKNTKFVGSGSDGEISEDDDMNSSNRANGAGGNKKKMLLPASISDQHSSGSGNISQQLDSLGSNNPLMVRKGSTSGGPMDEEELLLDEGGLNNNYEPRVFAAALNFEKVNMLKREIQQIGRLVRASKPRGVLPYLGILQKDECLYLCMRHCVGGSISGLLHTLGHGLPLEVTEYFALALLEGLAALHEHHLTHKDIDCSSILLDWSSNTDGTGGEDANNMSALSVSKEVPTSHSLTNLHVYLSSFASHYTSSLAANRNDMSISGSQSSSGGASPRKMYKPMDVWSLGCTIVEMLVGKPLHSAHRTTSMGQLVAPPIPTAQELHNGGKDLPKEAVEFFEKLFVISNMDRPSAADLLETEWMVNAKKRTDKLMSASTSPSTTSSSSASTVVLSPVATTCVQEIFNIVQTRSAQYASDRAKQVIEARKLSCTSLTAAKISPTLSPQVSGVLVHNKVTRGPNGASGSISPQMVPSLPSLPRSGSSSPKMQGFNFQNGEGPVNKRANRNPQTARASVTLGNGSGSVPKDAPLPLTGGDQAKNGSNSARGSLSGNAAANNSTHITPRRIVKN